MSWRDELPDDIKSAGELQNFDSVASLAKSHIEAQKTLSSRPASISGEEPADVFFSKAGKALGVKDDLKAYKSVGNDEISKVAMRYKVHPRQLKPLLEDIQPEMDRMARQVSEDRVKDYKDKVAYLEKEYPDHDLLRAKTAQSLKVSLSQLQEELGIAYHHPRVQQMLLALGSGNRPAPFQADGPAKTTEGGEVKGGSKDSVEDTMTDKLNYINKQMRPGTPFYDTSHADYAKTRDKVRKYTAELAAYQSKTGKDIRFL